MYATLLEETTQKYGSSSIEAGPAYYEYGNSILRATTKNLAISKEKDKSEAQIETDIVKTRNKRSATAAAAERRIQSLVKEEENKKPKAVITYHGEGKNQRHGEGLKMISDTVNDKKYCDDLNLALEMMENAFSILEEYNAKNEERKEDNVRNGDNDVKKYNDWVTEQIPRVLMGIGDTLSTLKKHADAADT